MSQGTIKMSTICKGDGSDETDKSRWALNNHDTVIFDKPPEGVGYGLGRNAGLLRDNHTLIFHEEDAPVIRVGPWEKGYALFRNADNKVGNSNISIEGLRIDGKKGELGLDHPETNPQFNSLVFRVVAETQDGRCENISFKNIKCNEWPGVFCRLHNCHGLHEENIYMRGMHRGGLIHAYNCAHGTIKSIRGYDMGDDGVAFNSVEALGGEEDSDKMAISEDFVIRDFDFRMPREERGGCPIAIRGGKNIRVVKGITGGGINAGVLIGERRELMPTEDIIIRETKVRNSKGFGVHVTPNVGTVRLVEVEVINSAKEPYKIRNQETTKIRCI